MAEPQAGIDWRMPDSRTADVCSDPAAPLSFEQLVRHLARLEQECQQIRSLLQVVQSRLTQQEQAIGWQLQAVTAWIEHRVDSPSNPCDSMSEPAGLYVQVLGGFDIWFQDTPLSLGSSKNGCAILRYLVMLPQRRAAKDVLLELFWPQDSPQKANHKLHNAISAIRQAFSVACTQLPGTDAASGEWILFADDCYSLAPDWPLELDADLFTACVRAAVQAEQAGCVVEAVAQYEAARALYRGDLLPEDMYADWTAAPRAHLEEMYLTLLGRLAVHYLNQQRFAESVACCRQILARDSFREDACRQLMCCYSRMGQRNQALRVFQDCQEVLRRELGVTPMHETIALSERIVREESV